MSDHQDDSARRRAAVALSASRRSDIASFIVMDVMRTAAAREAAGHRIIHMEVGQPGTPAPSGARAAVLRAIDKDPLGYTQALGMPELRERIARHYLDTYGLRVPAARVVVTSGSSAAFVLAFLALFDAGDRVALPQPGYPCYRNILGALGCEPVMLRCGPETRWMPTAADIDGVEAPLAGLLIASPANPTGTMLEPDRLAGLVDACRRRDMWFISDEIYHGLTYGGPEAMTALALSDDAIVINSFSKYFSMTGWRIGWMVVPDRLVWPVEKLAQNLYISPPTVSQVAALGAFESRDELEANRAIYAANRTLLLEGLPAVGFRNIVPADGAFYLYCNIADMTDDSGAFVRAMLEETGIATTPGIDFDAARGGRFMRFSYAGKTGDMAEALERLSRWSRLRG